MYSVVPDPFSQSLCSNCSTDLKNFHLWIEKAIETQKLLERSLKCSLDSNGIKKSVINEVLYLEECPETKFVTQEVSEKSESDNQHVEKQQNSFSGGHSIDDFDKHCSYGADELETDYGNHKRLDFVNEFCFPPGRKHDKKRNPERAYSWNDILKRNMGISEILANIERECATVLQDPDLTKEVKPKIKPLLHFKNRTLRFSVPTINRKRKKRSSVETGVCEKSNHASSISFIAKEELNTKDRPKKKPGLCSFCRKLKQQFLYSIITPHNFLIF